MDMEIINTQVSDFVATVTIDRPPVNAMNRQMFDEIQAAFDALNNRAEVRVGGVHRRRQMFLRRRRHESPLILARRPASPPARSDVGALTGGP